MPKLVRITTVPVSMQVLLKGQMRFMQEQGFEVTMISSDGPEVPALKEQEGCEHIPVTLTRKISPLTDLKSLILLVRILRKIKPDIVHTHTPKAGLIGMWAAWLAGVPVRLHTIAGLPWVESRGMMRLLLKTVEKLTALPASRIYPNSFVQKKFLEDQGIAVKKLKVLGSGSSNGINSRFFYANDAIKEKAAVLRSQEQVAVNDWVWIFVGRLVKDKGMAELLDAFLFVIAQFPGDRLWLLGEEEPELDPLEEKHRHMLHNHPSVKCWGFQKDIRPYLAAAQVLTFPSYREGFPNVPLQAGAMGCMLILSDINGCNEIVEDEKNGLLVPVKNTVALTDAMLRTRKDPGMMKQFAVSIQQHIRESYDQQALWKLILEEYREWLRIKKK